jgi:DNA-binding NtrC family response regulator
LFSENSKIMPPVITREPSDAKAGSLAETCSLLIVDDEPLICETLAEYLANEGFETAVCGSAEDALVLAGERQFDVALCDVQLPGIDGIQLLERLAKISPQTFVLLITAYATVESAVEAFHRGAHD